MQDFLLDDNGDLKIENGDFVLGNSDVQHQELLLLMDKGELKENPTKTVGLIQYINESENNKLVFETRAVFEGDGMTVNSIAFDEQNQELNYDANYKS